MRTPAQSYAAVVGWVLVVVGVGGFFASATFGGPGHTSDLVGIFRVNGWLDLLHLLAGLLGVFVAARPGAARGYATWIGLLFLVVAIWGFAVGSGGEILSFLPANAGDSVLALVVGLLGLGTAAGSHEPSAVASRMRA